jgi:hypothetical protein
MAGAYDSFVYQDGICAAGHNLAHRRPHVRQALNGPDCNAVIHRNNYRLAGIAVDYSFESYLFAYHCQISKPGISKLQRKMQNYRAKFKNFGSSIAIFTSQISVFYLNLP